MNAAKNQGLIVVLHLPFLFGMKPGFIDFIGFMGAINYCYYY